ncbi:MAG: ABC-2 transporter permease [Oscillospiraceae bacterium]|nr:ABC-2 transporter permease [Oscillospiraceae bacterium]
MKGLLLKDYYMMMKHCKLSFIISVIFIAVSLANSDNTFFLFYPFILCGIIPINLLNFDEKSRWTQYSGSLPYTKAQIVSSKYLIGLFVQIATMIFTITAHGIKMSINGGLDLEYFFEIIMLIVTAITFSSISLPFAFKFGIEKGIMAFYLSVGVLAVISYFAFGMREFPQTDFQAEMEPTVFLVFFCLIGMAVYIISWLLSIAFYRKRELG